MGWDKYTDWGAGAGKKYVPPTPEQSKEIRDILKNLRGGKKKAKLKKTNNVNAQTRLYWHT